MCRRPSRARSPVSKKPLIRRNMKLSNYTTPVLKSKRLCKPGHLRYCIPPQRRRGRRDFPKSPVGGSARPLFAPRRKAGREYRRMWLLPYLLRGVPARHCLIKSSTTQQDYKFRQWVKAMRFCRQMATDSERVLKCAFLPHLEAGTARAFFFDTGRAAGLY